MTWLKQLLSRNRPYGDLSEEIGQHLDEKVEELVASGMSKEEARYAAHREFGNITMAEEDGRDVWRWRLMEDFFADIRYGSRMLAACFDALVERAVAMARTVPEDPYCGIADASEIARDWPSLDMFDPEEPGAEVLIERARAAEEAALAVTGVTNSEGAEAGWGRSSVALAASNGFAGFYSGSSQGISASVIAGSGTGMERDYDFASAIHATDLRDPAEIGKSAGERAVKRLSAKKLPTCRCPVVFDPRVARGFISHLLGAISGPSIARGTSFLKDQLGERIFPEAFSIVEDPHRQRGLRGRLRRLVGTGRGRDAVADDGHHRRAVGGLLGGQRHRVLVTVMPEASVADAGRGTQVDLGVVPRGRVGDHVHTLVPAIVRRCTPMPYSR